MFCIIYENGTGHNKNALMRKIILLISLFSLAFSCSNGSSESDPDPIPEGGQTDKSIEVYLTVRNSALRLTKQDGIAFSNDASDFTIRLDTVEVKQEIEGFGASLTGSSAYLIKNMDQTARAALLKDLFTEEGIALKYLRLCIGSSDFSLGNYTYCDETDISKFAIPGVDKRDLLPVLKEILTLNKDIKLMGSPWSAPAWMKKNNHLYGGSLRGEVVYNDFAEYFIKYINAYKSEGITIDAITLQNEPRHQINTYPTMYMEWDEQNKIIRDYLGPKFRAAELATKILIWDHNFHGVDYPLNILGDAETRKYVAGSAFHGYNGTPADLSRLTDLYPEVPLYFTEQSGGGWNTDDPIGNMLYYMKDMLMPTINRGSRNFLMWNLALNTQNGPVTTKTGGCQNCRGVVTIKDDNKTYSVNEEYYLLGHFSKFIKKGAHRIAYSLSRTKPVNMEVSAFLNPDGTKVVVVLNQSGKKQTFTVRTANRRFIYDIFDQAVVTFIYM